jgi:REP element-mobilizing transposase RayT
MGTLDFKQFTERHRPHIHQPGATLFITYRLAGSIAQPVLRQYKAKKQWIDDQFERANEAAKGQDTPELLKWHDRVERFRREWFVKYEDVLHQASVGPTWLKDAAVAGEVTSVLRELDGSDYCLDAYCVMSNHIHAVFNPLLTETELVETRDENGRLSYASEHPGLARIMQTLKGRTARECNNVLGRNGQFWEHESFDHVIRQGQLDRTIRYVLNNPVKAGLVREWTDWQWSYCRAELIGVMS